MPERPVSISYPLSMTPSVSSVQGGVWSPSMALRGRRGPGLPGQMWDGAGGETVPTWPASGQSQEVNSGPRLCPVVHIGAGVTAQPPVLHFEKSPHIRGHQGPARAAPVRAAAELPVDGGHGQALAETPGSCGRQSDPARGFCAPCPSATRGPQARDDPSPKRRRRPRSHSLYPRRPAPLLVQGRASSYRK